MSADPFLEKGFAGAPLDDCLVIDAHGHLGEMPHFPLVDDSLSRLIASMDRMGIDVLAVSGIPALFGDAARGNRLVARALAAYPDRFFGYMAVDIGYPERVAPELERCLAAGFRGVKVWSYGTHGGLPYDHVSYRPVFEFADAHRLPVLAHTWGAELDQLEPSIRRFRHIHWLCAHAGSVDREKYIRLARAYETVFLELSFSACPRGLVEAFVAAGLASKVVWGSDAIFMGAAQQLGRVLFAQIAPKDKSRILGLNAQRALRLDYRPIYKHSISRTSTEEVRA